MGVQTLDEEPPGTDLLVRPLEDLLRERDFDPFEESIDIIQGKSSIGESHPAKKEILEKLNALLLESMAKGTTNIGLVNEIIDLVEEKLSNHISTKVKADHVINMMAFHRPKKKENTTVHSGRVDHGHLHVSSDDVKRIMEDLGDTI